MSETKTVSFGPETWKKGTRGSETRWVSERPVISNMRWSSKLRLYPRSRWRTGIVTTDTTLNSNMAGPINTDAEYAVLMDNYAYKWDAPTSLTDHTLTVMSGSSLITNSARWSRPQRTGANSFEKLGYQLEVSSSGVVSTSTDNIFDDIQTATGTSYVVVGTTVHQGRLFVCGYRNQSGVRTFTNRIWYSDPYDYMVMTDPAEQFFDVDGNVEGMVSFGANLLIWNDAGEWFMLQGRGDPAVATLSKAGKGRIPVSHYTISEVDGGFIFPSADHGALVLLNGGGSTDDKSLSRFSYTTANQGFQSFEDYLYAPPAASPVLDVVSGPIRGDSSHLVLQHGVWSEDTYDTFTMVKGSHLFFDENTGREVLVQPADLPGFAAWTLYSRNLLDGACDSDSDTGLAETDEVAGYIETPIIAVPDKVVRCKRVYIDAISLGTAIDGNDPPAPSLTVSQLGEGGAAAMTLGPGNTPLTTRMPANDTPTRFMATGGPNIHERGFNIALSNIRGMAIERVTVEIEVSNGPLQ